MTYLFELNNFIETLAIFATILPLLDPSVSSVSLALEYFSSFSKIQEKFSKNLKLA